MATRKSTRTNKTAHVLNLLTDAGEVKEEDKTPERGHKAPSRPLPSPPMEMIKGDNAAIESKIRAALEETTHMEVRSIPPEEITESVEEEWVEELAEESMEEELQEELAAEEEPATVAEELAMADITPAPEEESVTVLVEAPEATPALTEAPKPVAAAATEEREAAPVPQESPPPAAPGEKPVAAPAGAQDGEKKMPMPKVEKDICVGDDVITCVNVMQALVEEKADKYIAMFGLCHCPRCKIDVMALALTNLPSKYVVSKKREAIPMLTVYESRYSAAVISQVIWACKRVMDFPRHDM